MTDHPPERPGSLSRDVGLTLSYYTGMIIVDTELARREPKPVNRCESPWWAAATWRAASLCSSSRPCAACDSSRSPTAPGRSRRGVRWRGRDRRRHVVDSWRASSTRSPPVVGGNRRRHRRVRRRSVSTRSSRPPATSSSARRSASNAMRNGKHLVMMSAEVDASVGPILKTYADRAGVVLHLHRRR